MAQISDTLPIGERVARVETNIGAIRDTQVSQDQRLERIENKIDGRPSWGVVWVICALQATCGVLASALVLALVTH